jgi:hypothetical protein
MIKKSSKISTFPHPQNLIMIMGKPDEVSERRALEGKKNNFILEETAVDVWEDKMKFATCSLSPLFVVSAAATEMTHKDAGRGELCVESRIRKIHFNTLGESGRVAGGRVETL